MIDITYKITFPKRIKHTGFISVDISEEEFKLYQGTHLDVIEAVHNDLDANVFDLEEDEEIKFKILSAKTEETNNAV